MKQPKIDEKLEAENDGREAEAMKLRSKSIRRLSVQRLIGRFGERRSKCLHGCPAASLVTCDLRPRST